MKSLIVKVVSLSSCLILVVLCLSTWLIYHSDKVDLKLAGLIVPKLNQEALRDFEQDSFEYDHIVVALEDFIRNLPSFNKGSSGESFVGYENRLLAKQAQIYMNRGELAKARSTLTKFIEKDERSLWAISQLDYLDFLEKGDFAVSEKYTRMFPSVFEFEQNVMEGLLQENKASDAARLYWENYKKTITQQIGIYLSTDNNVKHFEWNPPTGEVYGDNVLSLSLKNPVETDAIEISFPIKKSAYFNIKLKINGVSINYNSSYETNSFLSLNSKYLRALSQGAYNGRNSWRYGPGLYLRIKKQKIENLEVTFSEIKDVSDILWLNPAFVNEVLAKAPTPKLAAQIREYLKVANKYVTRLTKGSFNNIVSPSDRIGMTKIDIPVEEFGYYKILVISPEKGSYMIFDEVNGSKVLGADLDRRVGRLLSRPILSSNNKISLSVTNNILNYEIICLKSINAPPENLNGTNSINILWNPASKYSDMVSRNASKTFFVKDMSNYYLDIEFFELFNSPRDLHFNIAGKEMSFSYNVDGVMSKKVDLGLLSPGYHTLSISANGVSVPDDTLHNGDKREIAFIFKKCRLVKGNIKDE